jgi:hypothetical protein
MKLLSTIDKAVVGSRTESNIELETAPKNTLLVVPK